MTLFNNSSPVNHVIHHYGYYAEVFLLYVTHVRGAAEVEHECIASCLLAEESTRMGDLQEKNG